MRVGIIGAGAAGLTSARHVTAQGIECEIFEMAAEIGGIWVYTDDVEKDKYGYPVHTAMYKGLRTNLPKEVMGFSDFPIPEQEDSFLSQEDILHFLNLYTDHFKLRELIKFDEMVTDVRPIGDKWQIKSIHKPTKNESVGVYDAVMVCNGHYSTPNMPKIPGEEKFEGTKIHCHRYRSEDSYQNQRVLIVGAGYSGLDLAFQIAGVAKSVTISHHPFQREIKGEYPANVSRKPEVVSIKNGEQVEFVDGSCCGFDAILYCTGYRYNFPFLHESCGIKIEDNHVEPLYKHMISIERPTLCFIGIPFYVCAFQMFDLQARVYCQFLNGSMTLPPPDLMLKDTLNDIARRKRQGLMKKQMHMAGNNQKSYFDDLASIANVTKIPTVITKIWTHCDQSIYDDLANFRKDKYRIVNNESFEKV